jgi:hypothetical protein
MINRVFRALGGGLAIVTFGGILAGLSHPAAGSACCCTTAQGRAWARAT